MKRKVLALAISQLFVPCVFAQGSSVTVYGTFNVDFENVERDGATNPPDAGNNLVPSSAVAGSPITGADLESRNRVSSNSSNIGFRGTEDLGNGLKAIFQCESGVSVDTGAESSSSGDFCTRNSNVGLTGGWGTVFYGNWDTPYKFSALPLDAFYAATIAAGNSILGQPGFNVVNTTQGGRVGSAADATFDRRQGNSVQYWAPVFKGFSARIAYSANEGRGLAGGVEINPYIWSIAATYLNGPLYLALAYERHEDYFGLFGITGAAAQGPSASNASSRDQAFKAGAGYTLGNTTLNLVYERLEYENDQSLVGAVNEYERNAVYVGLLHKIGAGTIRAAFGWADEGDCEAVGVACNTDELGAKHYVLGYSYSFSKRTDVYALFSKVDNDDLAAYNFGFNGLSGAGVGSDPSGFGLGIRHSF